MARTLPEVTTGPRPGAFGRFRSHGISTAQAWLVRHFSWDGGTTITVAAGEPSIPSRGATACRHLSSCRPTRHDKKISLWRSVATDLLLCGDTPVASVPAEGTDPPRSELPSCGRPIPLLPQRPVHLAPLPGGAFLCVQTLGTISRVPGFALVRKNGTLRE
jgi:hypothetical protein